MACGTDVRNFAMPATDPVFPAFGTVGTESTVILRFFPGEFKAQIFTGSNAVSLTPMQHGQWPFKASFLAGY